MAETIHSLFCQSAARLPDKVLFERDDAPSIGFGQAREIVERLASVLHERGVAPGERVAVQVEKSPEAVCLYLATLKLGAVFLPLNTAYTDRELDHFLGDSEPVLFVCAPDKAGAHGARPGLRVETLGERGDGSLMDAAETAGDPVPTAEAAPDDAAAILYTSGTTGRSKGAVLTHANLVSNCRTLLQAWRFIEEDRLIHVLPIFHVHGLFVACNMAIAAGATMLFRKRFEAEETVASMARASVLMGVPTFYTRLLRSDALTREAAASMRLFVSGSAPLLAEDHARFADRTGHRILERYGMTEAGMIASNPYEGERRAGAVGFPLAGIAVRITDRETGATLPAGEIGAVEVRGPNVLREYWRMPEKTAAEFTADGFFRTGDLGAFSPDGYLSIAGRDKDLVISGGFNVYPKEIETLIDAIEGVEESAVIGLPHPDLGEAVTAIVVADPGASIDEAAILALIRDDLARFKQPRRVVLTQSLPRNVMGKVQKAELRARYAGLYTEA